mgnify:CR=1 FL=1
MIFNQLLYKFLNIIFKVYYWIVIIFLLFPLIIVIPISFVNSKYLQFPPKDFSLRWYKNYFNDPEFFTSTLNSLYLGFASSILATIIGTMAAVGLSKTNFFGKKALIGMLLSPLIFPVIILGLGLYIFLANFNLTENFYALIIAHAALVMPFSLIIVSTNLINFDITLERAARILGASPFKAFWNVTLPYIKPAILSSAVFSFFISFDELVIALFISGKIWTLPQRIWQDLRYEIDPTIAAVASVLIIVTFIGILFGTLIQNKSKKIIEEIK